MSSNPIVKINELLLSLSPFELTTFAFLLGILFSEGLNSNQQQALGNFYEQLGQTILTVGGQMQNLNAPVQPNQKIDEMLAFLQRKSAKIEKILDDLKNL